MGRVLDTFSILLSVGMTCICLVLRVFSKVGRRDHPEPKEVGRSRVSSLQRKLRVFPGSCPVAGCVIVILISLVLMKFDEVVLGTAWRPLRMNTSFKVSLGPLTESYIPLVSRMESEFYFWPRVRTRHSNRLQRLKHHSLLSVPLEVNLTGSISRLDGRPTYNEDVWFI